MKIIFKCEGCGLEWAKPTDAVKCEEKHKEVTWYEAIEAWMDGKVIKLVMPEYEHTIRPTNAVELTLGKIKRGKWFIEAKS